jgi:hypothetical protein
LKDSPDHSFATLFDYLKGNGMVFVEGGDAVHKEVEGYSHLIKDRYEKAVAKKRSVPPPEFVYLSYEGFSLSQKGIRKLKLIRGQDLFPEFKVPHFRSVRPDLIFKIGDLSDVGEKGEKTKPDDQRIFPPYRRQARPDGLHQIPQGHMSGG